MSESPSMMARALLVAAHAHVPDSTRSAVLDFVRARVDDDDEARRVMDSLRNGLSTRSSIIRACEVFGVPVDFWFTDDRAALAGLATGALVVQYAPAPPRAPDAEVADVA